MQESKVVREALATLGDVPKWRVKPARWELVDKILDAMSTAVDASDTDALDAATADLELASPIRINRAGDPAETPPPKEILERVNHLVHSLGQDDKKQREKDNQKKK